MPLPTLCVLRTEVLPSNRSVVAVYFSAAVNTTDATNAGNYSIPGLTISGAAVSTVVLKNMPGTIINLTCTTPPVPGTVYDLQVSNVRNVGNTYTILLADGLKSFTPGVIIADPLQPLVVGGILQPATLRGAPIRATLDVDAEVTGAGASFNTGFN